MSYFQQITVYIDNRGMHTAIPNDLKFKLYPWEPSNHQMSGSITEKAMQCNSNLL